MKGYTSLKQFADDFRLYKTAKSMDMGRTNGESIISYMKKRIDERLKNATPSFKNKGYSKQELLFIAAHESTKRINNVEEFIATCFDKNHVSKDDYLKIFKSKPFKEGKLGKLYTHLPLSLNSKTDLLRYIKNRGEINKEELESLMDSLYPKYWRTWLSELVDERKIRNRFGWWYT